MPVLLILVSLLGAGEAPSGSHAALLYLRGSAHAARAETTTVLAKAPTDAPALFVRACLELETNGPQAAEPYVTMLERLPSPPPQAAVLRRLLARRRTAPAEPIEDALVEAWKLAGRPLLSDRQLLPEVDGWGVIPDLAPEVLGRMSVQERLLFSSGDKEHRFKLAAASGGAPELNPLVVNLEILEAVAPDDPLPVELRDEAARIAPRVGTVVTASDPANGYLQVAAWLSSAGGAAGMTDDDLTHLDAAVAKARFELPRHELLEQLRVIAGGFDPVLGDLRARSIALGSPLPLYRLWQRAEATRDPALRKRAGELLDRVARRLACSGTVLERMLGLSIAGKGAALRGDEDARAAIRRYAERAQAHLRAAAEGQKALGTWPFSSPWRQWDPDTEVEHFDRFSTQGPESMPASLTCSESPVPKRSWPEPGTTAVRDYQRRSGLIFAPCSDDACVREALHACRPAHLFEAHYTIEGSPVFLDHFVVPDGEKCQVVQFFDGSRDYWGGCRVSRMTCPTIDAAKGDNTDTACSPAVSLYERKPCSRSLTP